MTDPQHRGSRRSIRLQGYDYTQPGAYFVTICTMNRECTFGQIVAGRSTLSDLGRIVAACWVEIPQHFAYASLDRFVVMPNHLHGIVSLSGRRDTACRVPTTERFGKPVAGSLPTIMRAFKSAVTQRANRTLGVAKARVWQGSYYEHVIRDEASLRRIRQYIETNPLRWELDRENFDRHDDDEFDRWLDSFRGRPRL
jgi:REP-associated tyrosine transposase